MSTGSPSVAVIDYGAGNLRSVVKAIGHLGYEARVASRPQEVLAARAVILPGVGAAAEALARLEALGLAQALRQIAAEDRPLFGVCLGLQLLFASTEEGGLHPCLGLLPGRVRRLPPGLKVPHMGWNQVRRRPALSLRPRGPQPEGLGEGADHPIFRGIPDEAHFYFVHSYYAQPEDDGLVLAETDYGVTFASVLARGNLVATQFHPEKSGEMGLRMYRNFLAWSLGRG